VAQVLQAFEKRKKAIFRGLFSPRGLSLFVNLSLRGILRFARNDAKNIFPAATARRSCRIGVLFIGLAMLAALPAGATTYYVAASGSDANSGTSKSTPWQTIAKVNASTFLPGDSILFRRGDVWYGTSMVAPSSGASGAPITFGAYGSGANPTIKGSTFLTTSGFTLAPDTTTSIFTPPDDGTFSSDSGTRNWREQVSHLDITNSAALITVSVTASPGAALDITSAGIGPATTAPNTSSITRITWGGGNNGTTVPAGTTVTSDQISYNLDNSVDQMVTIFTTARNVEYYTNNHEALWSNFSGPDESQNATVSGYSTGGNVVIKNIVAINTTQYAYRDALGAAPVAVWEDGQLSRLVLNPLSVDQTPGSWFYDGTYLYIHASDNSNVATNGKTYSYATASSPSFTTWDNGNSYLIFDSLDQAETYNTSSTTLGGIYLTGSHSILRNAAFHDTFRHPVCVYTGATNNIVSNIVAYNAYGTSPLCIYGAGTTGNLIQNSTFYNDTYMREAYVFTGSVWSVVVAHGGASNNTMDGCLIYSTAGPFRTNTFNGHGYGVLVGDSGTSLTVSHSSIYGNFEWGVDVGSGGNSGLTTGASITFYSNLLDISASNSSATGGEGILLTGSVGSILYNNTVYGPGVANPVVTQASSSTGALVKNNIFWTGGYPSVDATSESGSAYDYNDYYSAPGSPFDWGGTAYDFASWKTASSEDGHSISSNPMLTSGAPLSAGGDYTLLTGSPAIDAGTNLGSSYQMGLFPGDLWPGSVGLVNQNTGGGWEMGAYVFRAGAGTLPLMGCCD
jgi:Right handed beta helix region